MWCESNFPCCSINFVLFNHMNNMPENNNIQPNVIFQREPSAQEMKKRIIKPTSCALSCHKLTVLYHRMSLVRRSSKRSSLFFAVIFHVIKSYSTRNLFKPNERNVFPSNIGRSRKLLKRK